MEEGVTEEEAVFGLGPVEAVACRVLEERSSLADGGEKTPASGIGRRSLLLLILGSPIWLSLAVAAFAVIFSLWISLWSVIVSLFAVTLSLVAGAPVGIGIGIFSVCRGEPAAGAAYLGLGIACAGLSILFFFLSRLTAKGGIILTKRLFWLLKRCFGKRGE